MTNFFSLPNFLWAVWNFFVINIYIFLAFIICFAVLYIVSYLYHLILSLFKLVLQSKIKTVNDFLYYLVLYIRAAQISLR